MNAVTGTVQQKSTPIDDDASILDADVGSGGVNTQADRNGREPKVILHFGPHKTGTSALQSFIHSTDVTTFFLSDHVSIPPDHALPGPKRPADFNFAHCMIRNYVQDNGEIRRNTCVEKTIPALQSYLTEQYQERNDVLIIAEDLDRFPKIDLRRIQNSLHPYQKIHVVMTYRRHVEWLLSWYHEICRLYLGKFMNQEKFPSFVDFIANKPRFITKGAYTMHNFLEQHNWTDPQYNSSTQIEIDVMHYHRPDTTLIQMLACDVLHLPTTCQALRNGTLQEPGRVRPSLAYLEECRWMHKTLPPKSLKTRQCLARGKQIANNLKQHNLTFSDLPLLRPSAELIDSTWNITIAAEMRYRHLLGTVNESADSFWKNTRNMFDDIVQSQWWSWDLERILKNESLRALVPPV